MTNDEIKSYFLQQTESNIHYENGQKVLEINLSAMKKFFNVKEITTNY